MIMGSFYLLMLTSAYLFLKRFYLNEITYFIFLFAITIVYKFIYGGQYVLNMLNFSYEDIYVDNWQDGIAH